VFAAHAKASELNRMFRNKPLAIETALPTKRRKELKKSLSTFPFLQAAASLQKLYELDFGKCVGDDKWSKAAVRLERSIAMGREVYGSFHLEHAIAVAQLAGAAAAAGNNKLTHKALEEAFSLWCVAPHGTLSHSDFRSLCVKRYGPPNLRCRDQYGEQVDTFLKTKCKE
jgi:hypothetical protein